MIERPSAFASLEASETRWRSVLDALEAAIARQRAALDTGDHADAAAIAALSFSPPHDLPPLPPSMVMRARRLLEQTSALIEEARAIADGLRPAGPAVHQQPVRRAAAMFDRRV